MRYLKVRPRNGARACSDLRRRNLAQACSTFATSGRARQTAGPAADVWKHALETARRFRLIGTAAVLTDDVSL
ncbi:Hypothetical protein NTJ_02254 [Nesidiocoris tenuis]|uniref:Uncharacterized protein n=1 Tax=Nesidiocoris tenuis TaxID=355587 RepID=A0ABN7AEZ0_9HEMI|nr:Hypothetical protein NTJ_02254 [Nesidiocoris tenuis]